MLKNQEMVTFDLLALNTVYVFFNKIIIPTNSRNRPLKKRKRKGTNSRKRADMPCNYDMNMLNALC